MTHNGDEHRPRPTRARLFRYVENELLGMKSLFESKEACLRQELTRERDQLAREADVLRRRVEEAETGRTAAEVRTRAIVRAEYRAIVPYMLVRAIAVSLVVLCH